MATRYEEITGLALRKVEAFCNRKEDCKEFVITLFRGLAKDFQFPPGAMKFLAVDENRIFANTTVNELKLCRDRDGFFYFGVEYAFDNSGGGWIGGFFARVRALYGVKKTEDAFVLRHNNDRRFSIPPKQDEMAAYYEELYQDLKAYYQRPEDEPERILGFRSPS
jgi:hypothetical protein